MNIKGLGRKILNGLPIVSLFRYDIGIDSVKLSFGKLSGHMLYASIPLVYLVGSLASGTPNPLGWKEAIGERGRERQEYNELYNEAVKCVEQDGNPGLTSLREITELYSRAGVTVNYEPEIRRPRLPRLTGKDLERVVQSCETEEGKIK